MLGDCTITPTLAVSDMSVAKNFYEGVLGLEPEDENYGGVQYKSGGAGLFVYESQYAGTNKATAASWNVSNLENMVSELKARGVAFEHYDFPGATLEGDIHVLGGVKSAWFKDPDGNILALTST